MQTAPAIDHAAELGLRVRQLSDLPPLSPVAQQLVAMLANEDVQVGALSRTIELDPGLTARIVGLARSAFFGYTGNIYSVRDAIVRVLGLETVKSLALTLALSGHFKVSPAVGLDLGRYWVTALLTAASCRALAARVSVPGGPEPDAAYLAGLVHNLGLLVMVHVFAQDMARALALAPGATNAALAAVERTVVGVDHHRVGGWLADRWHLPREVVVVMEHHHDPAYRGLHWPHARLVGGCARLADWYLDHPSEPVEDPRLFEDLGIGEGGLTAIRALFEQRLDAIRELAATLASAH